MEIEITKMRMLKCDNPKAIVSLLIDGSLAVHDIMVIKRSSGRIVVAMPSKPDNYGKYRDIVHPTQPELRQHINDAILAEYERQSLSNYALDI